MNKRKKIDGFLAECSASVLDVMCAINENVKGIAFITDQEKLVGSVTDGDIRRYIINGGNPKDGICDVVNRNIISLELKDESRALQIMQQKSISAIPVLNKNREILKIYFSDGSFIQNEKLSDTLDIPLVIMAGGKGSRLKPYTDILPKPLIPIGEETITERIIDKFAVYGGNSVYMIVNYKKEFIKAYFGEGQYKGRIQFVDEQTFLGTGGGLKLLEGKIETSFFLSNCDILINADYTDLLKFHRERKNYVTLVSARKNFSIPYGTIEISENQCVKNFVEKPSNTYLVNTGFYVIEPEIYDEIPDHTFMHITEIIEKLIKNGKRVGTYIIDDEEWMDMGQLDEMEKMKQKLGLYEEK